MITGDRPIDLVRAIRQKKLIVFSLSKGKMGPVAARIYGRFLISMLSNIALARAHLPEEARVKTMVYIDEFHNFITPGIFEIATEGRKYKMFLRLVTQTLGQNMAVKDARLLIENCGVRVVGRAGKTSRELLAKEMGVEEKKPRKGITRKKAGITLRDFKYLQPGEFIVQAGFSKPRKIKNRTILLKDKNAMSEQERKLIVQEQLKHYYQQRPEFTSTTVSMDEEMNQEVTWNLIHQGVELQRRKFTPTFNWEV